MESKKIVSVQYKSKYGNEYGGNAYSYYTEVPLVVGQIIKAPTKFGESRARVKAVDIDPSTLNKNVLSFMRTITSSDLLLDADGEPIMDDQQRIDDFFK